MRLASDAIGSFVEEEFALRDAIERGLEDGRAGRVVPHAQAIADMRDAIAAVRSKRAKPAMARPVVWSVDAYRDTLAIVRHIADDDPDTAERIVDNIEAAGHRLGEGQLAGGRVAGTFEKSAAPLPWILCYAVNRSGP